MSNELPDRWGAALSNKGVHSYGDLAAALNISKSTAHRLVTGRTSPSTVQAAADKFFDGDMDRVWELRDSTLRGYGPWEPPESVLLLTPKQRAAIEAVIAAMVPDEREGGGEDADRPAPNKRPATGPAKRPVLREVSEHEVDEAARQDPKSRARRTRGDD